MVAGGKVTSSLTDMGPPGWEAHACEALAELLSEDAGSVRRVTKGGKVGCAAWASGGCGGGEATVFPREEGPCITRGLSLAL